MQILRVLSLSAHLDVFLPPAASRFLEVAQDSVGTEWVDMVSVAKAHGPFASKEALTQQFESYMLLPAMQQLAAILDPEVSQMTALRDLKMLMDQRQLPHLGPYYTGRALEMLRWAWTRSEAPWVLSARHSVWAAQGVSVGSLVRTERIMAVVAAALWFHDIFIEVPARLFHAGVPPDANAEVCAQLQPTFRHMARDDHAERAALLSVASTAVNACRSGTAALLSVTGSVRLYVSHFPCLSCVAVLGQFSRLAPLLKLEAAYDNAWDD